MTAGQVSTYGQAMLRSARLLLESSLDYAGTFPPAGLPLAEAVEAYARARGSPERWMLGRLVVAAGSLPELERLVAGARELLSWDLSVVLRSEPSRHLDQMAAFLQDGMYGARIASIEFPPIAPQEIRDVRGRVPAPIECFFELPIDAHLDLGLEEVARADGHAKVRTGGVTAGAFPAPEALVRFMSGCAAAGLAFKATAGLHHAVRGRYPLTCDGASETAAMYGVLNVALAAALVRAGAAPPELNDALIEPSADAFRFSEEGVRWRDRFLSHDDLAGARGFFRSFGSCAVGEPVDELRALGLL
jgi:hypothetical protein